jgi:hypothetical protein
MRRQKRFSAHFGGESNHIFIYDYDHKYHVDLASGSVKKFYGKEQKTVSTPIEGFKTFVKDTTAMDKIRTEAIGQSPEGRQAFVMDYVRSLIRKGDKKTFSVAEIAELCSKHEIGEEEIKKAISELNSKGEIFMMDRNTISSIHLFK